jgi:Taurine catabolism dioxygenase TauD, TfdA family
VTFIPFGPDLIIDAACSHDEIGRVMRVIAPFREEELWQDQVQSDLRSLILAAVPRLAVVAANVERHLFVDPHCCIIRGAGFETVTETECVKYTAAISLLLGNLSHSNVSDAHSGRVVELVRPICKEGRDVTYTLGACEAHADESSKLAPEDVACLWCIRQARWGGATVVWTARKLMSVIADMPGGEVLLRLLRTKRFPFGGKLRQPPRVLMSPILFGQDGVRFRLGTIEDGFAALKQEPDSEQSLALDALSRAIRSTIPSGWRLVPGEALIVLNRRVLHAREDFDDMARCLIRTRLYNQRLSNSFSEEKVSWYAEEPQTTNDG